MSEIEIIPIARRKLIRRAVPEEWVTDSYDYQRLHSDEELKEFLKLTPEQILTWLEEEVVFVWEAKRQWMEKG